jgi:hypothetical protein
MRIQIGERSRRMPWGQVPVDYVITYLVTWKAFTFQRDLRVPSFLQHILRYATKGVRISFVLEIELVIDHFTATGRNVLQAFCSFDCDQISDGCGLQGKRTPIPTRTMRRFKVVSCQTIVAPWLTIDKQLSTRVTFRFSKPMYAPYGRSVSHSKGIHVGSRSIRSGFEEGRERYQRGSETHK